MSISKLTGNEQIIAGNYVKKLSDIYHIGRSPELPVLAGYGLSTCCRIADNVLMLQQ